LKNSPVVFSRTMNKVLGNLIGKCAHVYMDDIVVMSKTVEEHLEHLEAVFSRLRAANLTANGPKTKLMQISLIYLGHVVSAAGIQPDPSRVEAILKLAHPTSRKGVKSFLGAAGWLRHFVKNFATIDQPLRRLLKKEVKFEWDEKCMEAFSEIRDQVATQPL